MREKMKEFVDILRAKDPIIYVNTYEENEFLTDLCEVVRDIVSTNTNYRIPPRIYTYTRPTGLYQVDIVNPTKAFLPQNVVKDVRNINEAIAFVRNLQHSVTKSNTDIFAAIGQSESNNNRSKKKDDKKEEEETQPAIFIFKDLHQYMTDKDVVRFLRDCKEEYFGDKYCPIIVTSPVTEIPPEVEKLFTYWEYPLMNKEELANTFNKYLGNMMYSDAEKEEIITAACGLTSREVLRAIMHSMAKNSDKKVRASDIYEEKIQLVKKSGCIDYVTPQYTMDDLGGCDNFKIWMKKMKEALTPEAQEFGVPCPKGAMMVGVPGTSKSASAEILASYLNVPLLSLQMAKVMGSFVGQSERAIANALRIAKSVAPCVLLMDEVEKTFGGVQSSNSTDSGTLSRVMANVLNFLQDDSGVIVMMTSNDVSQLPPELTRSGRIDVQWLFDLPNKFERGEIIDIYLKKNKLSVDTSVHEYMVDKTENFTGAEIKSAIKDMLVNSYYRQKKANAELTHTLAISDVEEAINGTVTVWKSSKEKIQAFRDFSQNRYVNASKSVQEIAQMQISNVKDSLSSKKTKTGVKNIFKLQ